MKRISIDPVTRLEGHGKIDIFLNDEGEVANAYLQIPELRGFERFCVGRPAEEMPNLTARICGVCPRPITWRPPSGRRRVPRRAAAGRQEASRVVLQHFRDRPYDPLYALGGPDFVVGPEAPQPSGTFWASGQGRHGHRQQGAQDASRRPRPDQDDRRPAVHPTGACPAA